MDRLRSKHDPFLSSEQQPCFSITMSVTNLIRLTHANTQQNTPGSYTYQLSVPVFNPKNLQVALISAEICNSSYNINGTLFANDQFQLTFQPATPQGQPTTKVLNLADGCMDPIQICDAFSQAQIMAGCYWNATNNTTSVVSAYTFASLTWNVTSRSYLLQCSPVPSSSPYTSNGVTYTSNSNGFIPASGLCPQVTFNSGLGTFLGYTANVPYPASAQSTTYQSKGIAPQQPNSLWDFEFDIVERQMRFSPLLPTQSDRSLLSILAPSFDCPVYSTRLYDPSWSKCQVTNGSLQTITFSLKNQLNQNVVLFVPQFSIEILLKYEN